MKKTTLSFLGALLTIHSHAQCSLSGTDYTQHFDNLAYGLPPGWEIDTAATAIYLGSSASSSFIPTPGTTTSWSNSSAGFKNVASANGFSNFKSASTSLQTAAADRALGIRQTAKFGDPGAAFVFHIDHTYGLTDFKLEFLLQSLDSSGGGRITNWRIEYAIGAPNFFKTMSAIGIHTTGGNRFSNDTIVVDFGKALDNLSLPVWIRIIAPTISTGPGFRATAAIDNFHLSWSGMAIPTPRPLIVSTAPGKNADGIPGNVYPEITFNKSIVTGTGGNFYIKNETDNTLKTIPFNDPGIVVSGNRVIIGSAALLPGKTFHITFDSSIAESAGWNCYGLYDTTEWRFSTIPYLPTSLNEQFDTSCIKGRDIPYAWSRNNIAGRGQEWYCHAAASGKYFLSYQWICRQRLLYQ